jgi:hypothetical protein
VQVCEPALSAFAANETQERCFLGAGSPVGRSGLETDERSLNAKSGVSWSLVLAVSGSRRVCRKRPLDGAWLPNIGGRADADRDDRSIPKAFGRDLRFRSSAMTGKTGRPQIRKPLGEIVSPGQSVAPAPEARKASFGARDPFRTVGTGWFAVV